MIAITNWLSIWTWVRCTILSRSSYGIVWYDSSIDIELIPWEAHRRHHIRIIELCYLWWWQREKARIYTSFSNQGTLYFFYIFSNIDISLISCTISDCNYRSWCRICREYVLINEDISSDNDERLSWGLWKYIFYSAISYCLSRTISSYIYHFIFEFFCSWKVSINKIRWNISRKKGNIFSHFVDKCCHSHTSKWFTNIIWSIKDERPPNTSKNFYFRYNAVTHNSEFCSYHRNPADSIIPCISRECKCIWVENSSWKVYPSSTIRPCISREKSRISWSRSWFTQKNRIFKACPADSINPEVPSKHTSYCHCSW